MRIVTSIIYERREEQTECRKFCELAADGQIMTRFCEQLRISRPRTWEDDLLDNGLHHHDIRHEKDGFIGMVYHLSALSQVRGLVLFLLGRARGLPCCSITRSSMKGDRRMTARFSGPLTGEISCLPPIHYITV